MFSSYTVFLVSGIAAILAIRSVALATYDDISTFKKREVTPMKTIAEYAHINTAEIDFKRPEFAADGPISKYANIDTASIDFEPAKKEHKEKTISFYANIDTRER